MTSRTTVFDNVVRKKNDHENIIIKRESIQNNLLKIKGTS